MEPFVGQIMMVGFNFAPRGWASCTGQLLPISQNDALFSLIGTIYGGDGRTTFGLPNLMSRVPIHQGQGPGLSSRHIGQQAGVESHTLTVQEMPAHNHPAYAQTTQANQQGPAGCVWAGEAMNRDATYSNANPDTPMRPDSVTSSGGDHPHSNIQPYLAVNFIIALSGIYPSRT